MERARSLPSSCRQRTPPSPHGAPLPIRLGPSSRCQPGAACSGGAGPGAQHARARRPEGRPPGGRQRRYSRLQCLCSRLHEAPFQAACQAVASPVPTSLGRHQVSTLRRFKVLETSVETKGSVADMDCNWVHRFPVQGEDLLHATLLELTKRSEKWGQPYVG